MLTTEDGSIIEGAESYLSVEAADLYHTARNNAAWAEATELAREAALRRATDYLEARYRLTWKGTRKTQDQPLSWPRSGVVDQDGYVLPDDAIPKALKTACAEAALRALSGDLQPDLQRGGAVKREKVGPIEVEYLDGAAATTAYPAIERPLSGLIRNRNAVVRG